MTMKKTDLARNMAMRIEGKRKSAAIPQRFGGGAAAVAAPAKAAEAVVEKRVALSCRLPAGLLAQLRERALDQPGGINAVIEQALVHWLADGASSAGRT